MTDANASKNGLDKVVKGLKANVFDLLSELVNNKSREYDFIILDPPAFTKSGSTVKNAIRGYKEINLKAMKLLAARRLSGDLFLLTFYEGRAVCADAA